MTLSVIRRPSLSGHLPSVFSDDFFGIVDKFFDDNMGMAFPESSSIPYDVRKYKDRTVIDLAVAGFKKDDIKVHVDNGHLKIKGAIINEDKDVKHEFLRKGISKRNFEYSFALSDWVDEAGIQANVKDGILSIKIPDKKEADVKGKVKEIALS